MHATPLHPRRALLAAAAALALALMALMPAAIDDDFSFSLAGTERSAPVQAPAPATSAGEPAWQDNPFSRPLLQAPAK